MIGLIVTSEDGERGSMGNDSGQIELPSVRLQKRVDLLHNPGEQSFVQRFSQGIATVIGLIGVFQTDHPFA